ncbi:toprim domain-containing protein [Spirosoma agri]|uniref:Toprim domain-containing protein n=1 Tax=Spirosoma agri TaxID=1987381 RepID=A0A6M0IK94_9BACT|nr:toprim domain-containing protein [Spirosoma agri]NEU68287.1 toprim domain-containing protein [Spirosoma agri]
MTKLDELRKRFPNLIPVQELRATVSIIELALHYGYELQPNKGHSRPVLEHTAYQDRIVIKNPRNPAQQVYQRAGDFADSGTIIDFIRNRLVTVFSQFNQPADNEFKNITSVLYSYLQVDAELIVRNPQMAVRLPDDKPKEAFDVALFDIRPLENENYLIKRQISPETINSPEFAGKVVSQVTYYDPKGGHAEQFPTVKAHPQRQYIQFTNVAFPYYNGLSADVTGLELRNEQVKLHAPGSDRLNSVFLSNPVPIAEQFFVLESAIDALSHKQLRTRRGDDTINSVYFSTGGQLTPQQVDTITRYIDSFKKSPAWRINLAFDNDTKGHLFDLQFIQQLIAIQLPIRPTAVGPGRIGYRLPAQERYWPLREALLDRIATYNNGVRMGSPITTDSGESQLLMVVDTNGQFDLVIPEAIAPLSAVCTSLLELTRLNQRVQIIKSLNKDFNEDLRQEIN